MKFRFFILCFVTLVAAAAMAQDDQKQREEVQQRESFEFRRESRPEGQRYSFDDYIQDLTAAARSDEPLADNPVSQLALNDRREHEYKPLNPIPLLRW
jgi:hypothetical protein